MTSRLIVGPRVCQASNDKEQLAPTMASIEPAAGSVKEVLNLRRLYSLGIVLKTA